jgi:hypothetical protein
MIPSGKYWRNTEIKIVSVREIAITQLEKKGKKLFFWSVGYRKLIFFFHKNLELYLLTPNTAQFVLRLKRKLLGPGRDSLSSTPPPKMLTFWFSVPSVRKPREEAVHKPREEAAFWVMYERCAPPFSKIRIFLLPSGPWTKIRAVKRIKSFGDAIATTLVKEEGDGPEGGVGHPSDTTLSNWSHR